MTDLGDKSFLPEFHGRLASGRKTATSRTVCWGKIGDTFTHAGMTFRLLWVQQLRLSQVVHLHFWAEGFDTPEGVIAVWNRIHPRAGYQPDQVVWYHEFKRIYEYEIGMVWHCLKGGRMHNAHLHRNIGANVIWCPHHGVLATTTAAQREVPLTNPRRFIGEKQMSEAQYEKFVHRSRWLKRRGSGSRDRPHNPKRGWGK